MPEALQLAGLHSTEAAREPAAGVSKRCESGVAWRRTHGGRAPVSRSKPLGCPRCSLSGSFPTDLQGAYPYLTPTLTATLTLHNEHVSLWGRYPVDIKVGEQTLPSSAVRGRLLTLTKVEAAGCRVVAVARSYDGHAWEGIMPEPLQPDCTGSWRLSDDGDRRAYCCV